MVQHEGEPVYGGIDTHADTHHVAVIDVHGRALGDMRVPATAAGYRQAVRFIGRWPQMVKVGARCEVQVRIDEIEPGSSSAAGGSTARATVTTAPSTSSGRWPRPVTHKLCGAGAGPQPPQRAVTPCG